jgi:hypothetical protein
MIAGRSEEIDLLYCQVSVQWSEVFKVAQCLLFVCNKCGFSIEGWDDGNPYIENSNGKRKYYYHPEEPPKISLTFSFGNAPDYVCRKCGKISKIDPDKDAMQCRKCKSEAVEEIYNLGGKKCLKCDGQFSQGESIAIS